MTRPGPALKLVEGGLGRAGGVARAFEFAAVGVAFALAIAALARLPGWFWSLGAFQARYGVAFALYLVALAGLSRWERLPRVGLAVFAVALATRALLVPLPPSLSGDVFRYVWEGRVTVSGGNPYREAPDDPALTALRDRDVWEGVNHKSLSTIYPPLAEAGYALIAALAPGVVAMKAWVGAHDLALVAALIWALRRRGRSPAWALVYAWNPLVLVEYAGTGHNDPTALLWLVLAIEWREDRPVASALALAAGALTKLAPLVALPFLWRRWPWRARIAAAVPLVLGLAWFARETHHTYSGLAAYWGAWRNNELLFAAFERVSGGFAGARALGLGLTAGVAAAAWFRRWSPEAAVGGTFAAALLTSPVVHPWYLGWLLALAPFRPGAFAVAWSLTLVLNYGAFATPPEGRGHHPPLGVRAIEYGVPAACALLVAWRRRVRPGAWGF